MLKRGCCSTYVLTFNCIFSKICITNTDNESKSRNKLFNRKTIPKRSNPINLDLDIISHKSSNLITFLLHSKVFISYSLYNGINNENDNVMLYDIIA